MNSTRAIGIDVGGTSIKSALVDIDGAAVALARTPTPQHDETGERTVAIVADLVARYTVSHGPAAVGVAVPGVVDEDSGTVVSAVNLGWQNLRLKRMLEQALGGDIHFGQDVRAGAFAESARGAARHSGGTSVFMPIGTGVAAATLTPGGPLVAGGWAGEIGQIPVLSRSSEGGTPSTTVLESVASAAGIARRLGCSNGKEAVALVVAGDEDAVRVWVEAVEAITEALAWISAVVAPEVIVVGGGLAQAGQVLFTPLEHSLAQRLGALRVPELVPAHFGDEAATVGAALLALRAIGTL